MHDTGYLGSMGGTLYAAMGMHSYILTIVCCGAQVLTSFNASAVHLAHQGMTVGHFPDQ